MAWRRLVIASDALNPFCVSDTISPSTSSRLRPKPLASGMICASDALNSGTSAPPASKVANNLSVICAAVIPVSP